MSHCCGPIECRRVLSACVNCGGFGFRPSHQREFFQGICRTNWEFARDTVAALWDCLFDDSGAPLAALTVGGHDHNVTWYEPRPKVDPDRGIVPLERGIHVHVNGAGGHGHDETSGVFTGFFRPISGTTPQFADDDNWCVTRIDLIGPRAADISILSFGTNDPPTVTEPTLLKTFAIRL